MKKSVYWLLSGEGVVGTWERVVTSPRGIKLRLTRERCGGARWARAYSDFYFTDGGAVAGYDVETNQPSFVTRSAFSDVA